MASSMSIALSLAGRLGVHCDSVKLSTTSTVILRTTDLRILRFTHRTVLIAGCVTGIATGQPSKTAISLSVGGNKKPQAQSPRLLDV